MKLKFTQKLLSAFIVLVMTTGATRAQDITNMAQFLNAGSEDASTFMGNYLDPVFTGFGYGAAGGWYNTAKAHKPLGFDLTFTMNAAFVPSNNRFFDILASDYNNVELTSGSSPTTSTVFGDTENTTRVSTEYTQDGVTINAEFDTPEGLGLQENFNVVPMPMIQAGIGLIKNTDLKVRWMPTFTFTDDLDNESTVGMFGVGIMHDFKQWIPAIKHIPIDMAVLVGYNRIYAEAGIEGVIDKPEDGTAQAADFAINSWTYQLLVSKKLSVLTVYAGVGFNNTSTTLNVLGDYELREENTGATIVLNDPVKEEYASSGMRGTLGLRLKLAVITFHADYTIQEYNTLSVGLGFSVR